jgi:hypothetical protein
MKIQNEKNGIIQDQLIKIIKKLRRDFWQYF